MTSKYVRLCYLHGSDHVFDCYLLSLFSQPVVSIPCSTNDCQKDLKVKAKTPLTEFLETVKTTLLELPARSRTSLSESS